LKKVKKSIIQKVLKQSLGISGFCVFLFAQGVFFVLSASNAEFSSSSSNSPDPPVYIVNEVDQYKAYFEGTALANGDVHIRIMGENGYTTEAVVEADSFGDWSYMTGILNSGNYSTTSWVYDEWNVKSADTENHPFDISLVVPTFTVTINKSEYEVVLTGSDGFPGGKVRIHIDGPGDDFYSDEVYSDLDGNWVYESGGVNSGDHVITAYSLDGYGNSGPSVIDSVIIDLQKTNFNIEVNASNELTIVGDGAIPDGAVRLNIEGDNGHIFEKDLESDDAGNWEYTAHVFGSGAYKVTAHVIDGNSEEGLEAYGSFSINITSPSFTLAPIGQNRKLEYMGTDGIPNGRMHIVITGPDGYSFSDEISVDASGDWHYRTPPLIKEGNYETWAYSLDMYRQPGPTSSTQRFYVPQDIYGGNEIIAPSIDLLNPELETTQLAPKNKAVEIEKEKLKNGGSFQNSEEGMIILSSPTLLPRLPGHLEDWRRNITLSMERNPLRFFFIGSILVGIAFVSALFKLGSMGQLLIALQGMLQNSYVLPFVLGRSKKESGFVYDNQTGKPVSLARVRLLNENGQEMGRYITDTTGIYSFYVPEGKYVLDIEKKGYAFYKNNSTSAVYYADSYNGDQIICTERRNSISKNIALSPVYYKKQEEIQRNGYGMFLDTFFIVGFFASVLFFSIHTTAWYFLPMLIFIASGFLQRMYARKCPYGTVIRKKDIREPNAIMEIHDKITGDFVARTVTNEKGRYYLMLNPGIFSLTVLRKGADAWTKDEIVTLEKKLVNKKIHVTS